MTLRAWLRRPVGRRWWLHLLVWPPVALLLLVLVVGYAPEIWDWLMTSEDLGTRLRRECESVVREALRGQQMSGSGRQNMIAECIFERGKRANR